jgi:hypothetical protein
VNSLKRVMTVGLIVGLLGAAADCSSGQANGGGSGSCQPNGIGGECGACLIAACCQQLSACQGTACEAAQNCFGICDDPAGGSFGTQCAPECFSQSPSPQGDALESCLLSCNACQ